MQEDVKKILDALDYSLTVHGQSIDDLFIISTYIQKVIETLEARKALANERITQLKTKDCLGYYLNWTPEEEMKNFRKQQRT